MLNLRQLTYFVAVADAGSYTGAARRLHVSQPALSARLKELEAGLRVRLFDRHARGISLTGKGQVLLPHAREVIAAARRAELSLEQSQGEKQQISLGVTPTLGTVMLPKLLEQCWLLEPSLSLLVQQGPSHRLAERVAAGELDAALCYSVPASLEAAAIPQYSEDLYLVGLPALLASWADAAIAQAIASLPLVLDPRGHPSREMIEEFAVRTGITLKVAADVEPLATKKALMLARGFCAIVPAYLFRDEIDSGDFTTLRLSDPLLTLTLKLILRRALPVPPAEKLRAIIAAMIRREIETGHCRWRLPG